MGCGETHLGPSQVCDIRKAKGSVDILVLSSVCVCVHTHMFL